MTVYSFASLIGKSVAFRADTDVLSFSGAAAGFSLEASGANLIVHSSNGMATLTGMTLAQVTTTNFSLSDTSAILVGDNTTGIVNDGVAQGTPGALDLVTSHTASLDSDNLIYGLGGGDTIAVGNGNNHIFGGSGRADSADGSDSIIINGTTATSGNNDIYANGGNDTVLFLKPTGLNHTAIVHSGLGNDNVISNAASGNLVFYGNEGNDSLDAADSTGNVTLFGGNGLSDSTDGADVLTTGLGNAVVYGNGGNDNILFDDFQTGITQTLYAGAGDDSIQGDVGGAGSTGNLIAYGGAGKDLFDLRTHYGAATVYGGIGIADSADTDDTFLIGSGNGNQHVTLYANGGNDTVTSTAALASGESETIFTGVGNDVISFSGARNAASVVTIDAGPGNDTIGINDAALTSNATVTIRHFESTDVLNVTLNGGTATDLHVTVGSSLIIDNGIANGHYILDNYAGGLVAADFKLSDGSLLYVGTKTAATITGTANNDQMIAGSAGDNLNGGAGNDILTGSGGADSLSGGAGVDTIHGGAGNDTIHTDDGSTIPGAIGNYAYGDEGSDSIMGGIHNDLLVGGLDNDTINGGGGADTLTGGIGNDMFSFTYGDIATTEATTDVVTDFLAQPGDVITIDSLTNTALHGAGTLFALGDGAAVQTLGANVGLYVSTHAVTDFTEANIYAGLGGIAPNLAAGDILYAIVSNGVDSMLVRITESANPGTLVAADDSMDYIAKFSGVDTAKLAALTEGNFSNFA